MTAWLHDWWLNRHYSLPRLTLEGPRVTLTPPCLDDWPEWRDVRGRNQAYLQPFEPAWPLFCLTRKFFIQRLKRQSWDWHQHLARYFLVRLKENKTLIGGVNINNIMLGAGRHASLGYWIDEAHQGRGLMQESVQCAIDYAFRDLGLQRIHAACIPENDKSRRLIKRLGMVEEGFAKDYVQINGVWRDHHLYGLTRDQHSRMA